MDNTEARITGVDMECPSCKKSRMQQGTIPLSRIIEKLDLCFKKNDIAEAERLLEYWQAEAQAVSDTRAELSIVNEMLGVYRKSENRKKAEAAVLRARELLKICELENSVSGATILINAATTMKAFGNPSAAKELYETAEKIYTDSGVPKDDPQFAALYNNYATTLTELCEFAKAERLYLLAQEITEKSISTLPDCAVTLVNMAHLYEDWEGTESEKIEICLTRAEKILLGNDTEENSYLAFVLSKCAPSFEYFGFFIAAKEMNKKSRRLYEGA